MARVIFKDNNQVQFLQHIKLISGLTTNELSILCGVVPRSLRDWLRGKHSISEKALLTLISKFSLPIPNNIEIVDDFWYVTKGARKGALKRLKLYGPPGTPEGRIRGGIMSQLRRREDPEKYRLLGCNLRKAFKISGASVEFAEAVGIILGDGAITNNHLRVTVSSMVDKPYADFIKDLFYKVFGEEPKLFKRKYQNALDLTINGAGIVEELERWSFIRGDKVRNQVDFPKWIWSDIEFQKACVRGLMDTDGGCYFHKHKTNGLVYRNFGMCFTNKSLPIVSSVAKILNSLEIRFSLVNQGTQIYIYSFAEIKKYFSLIGSNNPKNIKKFSEYLHENTHRVFKRALGHYATSPCMRYYIRLD